MTTDDDAEAGATGRAAATRTSGPRGCLLALAITSALGVGSIVAGKAFFERRNASVLGGAQELGAVLAEAGHAPGAAAVLALGCESAGVLSPSALRELGARLEAEEARKKGRPPRPLDAGSDEPVVFCAHPAPNEPSCARVAEVYLPAGRPAGSFVVTVRTGFNETCAERFAATGASMGPAPSPDLPLLVSPR